MLGLLTFTIVIIMSCTFLTFFYVFYFYLNVLYIYGVHDVFAKWRNSLLFPHQVSKITLSR